MSQQMQVIFFEFSESCTRGHVYKLHKCFSSVNAHKYCFANRICEIWNNLPSAVVEAPSANVFIRLLDTVDIVKYCSF